MSRSFCRVGEIYGRKCCGPTVTLFDHHRKPNAATLVSSLSSNTTTSYARHSKKQSEPASESLLAEPIMILASQRSINNYEDAIVPVLSEPAAAL